MKNLLSLVLITLIFLISTLGCGIPGRLLGSSEPNTRDKSVTDKGIDIALGNERIGVPECDEVLDELAEQMRSADDNYITKATKGYILNKIRESVRESIKENQNDKIKMAKECRDFKLQLDKQLAEEKQKEQSNR